MKTVMTRFPVPFLFLLLFLVPVPRLLAEDPKPASVPVDKAKRITDLEAQLADISRQEQQLQDLDQDELPDAHDNELENLGRAREDILKELKALQGGSKTPVEVVKPSGAEPVIPESVMGDLSPITAKDIVRDGKKPEGGAPQKQESVLNDLTPITAKDIVRDGKQPVKPQVPEKGPEKKAEPVEEPQKKSEDKEVKEENGAQGYLDHVRAREMNMDGIYGVGGCGKTLQDFLTSQGITTALESVTNWERVPFAGVWGQVRGSMYWQAETELNGAILSVQNDPVVAPKHLAELTARMAEWDRLEQGIQVLFRRALEQTLIIARMKEKSNEIFLSSSRKQKDAELAAIDSQVKDVKRIREGIFDEIKKLAKSRPSFVIEPAGLPLPAGVKKPQQVRPEEEGLPLPAKAVEWAADRKEKQLKEASANASAAEAAAQAAATAAEEAVKDAEFMKKRYEDDLRRADDLRKEYEMTSGRDKKAADKLFEELKRADALAAKSAAEWKADERKRIAAESESGRLRKAANIAWENYRLLKADIEKSAVAGR